MSKCWRVGRVGRSEAPTTLEYCMSDRAQGQKKTLGSLPDIFLSDITMVVELAGQENRVRKGRGGARRCQRTATKKITLW